MEKKKLLVYVECKVVKQLTVEGCTEDEAYDDPWEFAVDEVEIDQVDWSVLEVKEYP